MTEQLNGFPVPDLGRLELTLNRITLYLDARSSCLTGGLAVQQAVYGLTRKARKLNDIDIITNSLDSIDSELSKEFLVIHYHTPHPGYDKFLLQLAHPESRLRIDIFPNRENSNSFLHVQIGTEIFNVLTASQIFKEKLKIIEAASFEKKIDPKHFEDAVSLAQVLDVPVPKINPRFLEKEVYCQSWKACLRCKASEDGKFPLSDKEAVYDILGYY